MSAGAPGRVVVSHFRAKPGRADEVREVMRWHVAATHEEPGVLLFALNQAEGDPDEFVVVEAYADAEDLAKHKQTPHYEKSMAALPDLLEGRPETTLYDAIPLGQPDKGVVS